MRHRGGRGAVERGQQQILCRIVQRVAGVDRLHDLADPVDDREHRVDQLGIGGTFTGPDTLQHVLRGMAQAGQARQVQEAAATLHRVNEAEDRIQPAAIRRIGLPRHDLPR